MHRGMADCSSIRALDGTREVAGKILLIGPTSQDAWQYPSFKIITAFIFKSLRHLMGAYPYIPWLGQVRLAVIASDARKKAVGQYVLPETDLRRLDWRAQRQTHYLHHTRTDLVPATSIHGLHLGSVVTRLGTPLG